MVLLHRASDNIYIVMQTHTTMISSLIFLLLTARSRSAMAPRLQLMHRNLFIDYNVAGIFCKGKILPVASVGKDKIHNYYFFVMIA